MNRRLRKLFDGVLDLLYPPKCSACGELLEERGALCPECLKKFSEECAERCADCGSLAGYCKCRSSEGFVPDICTVFYRGYDESGERVTETLMYRLKREYDTLLMDFFARDTAAHIVKYFLRHGENAGDYVVTFSPRSEANMRKYGYDHCEYMAKRIAEYVGVPLVKTVIRHGGAEQKGLTSAERHLNVKRTLSLCNNAEVDGKKVLLFDDLVTTGATMSRCVSLLREAGARDMLTVSIARTSRERGKA